MKYYDDETGYTFTLRQYAPDYWRATMIRGQAGYNVTSYGETAEVAINRLTLEIMGMIDRASLSLLRQLDGENICTNSFYILD